MLTMGINIQVAKNVAVVAAGINHRNWHGVDDGAVQLPQLVGVLEKQVLTHLGRHPVEVVEK